MKFIDVPNLPQGRVKLAVVDGRIEKDREEKLCSMGLRLIKTRPCKSVYDAISYHPDIMIHHAAAGKIICAPETNEELVEELINYGFDVLKGQTRLSLKYPGNIAYNVARVGSLAFHNLKYTDAKLRLALEEEGVELVHVNQGYVKCAVSVVDQSSIITSDPGIAKAAEAKGLEVLRIEDEEHILLPGLKNGFIGGSAGLVCKNKWAITGDVCRLKSSRRIYDFLTRKNIDIICLSEGDVIDMGTIIPLMEE